MIDDLTESEKTCVRDTLGAEVFDDLFAQTVVENGVWFESFPMGCLGEEIAGGLSVALVAAAAGGLSADSRNCLAELYADPDVLAYSFVLSSDFGSEITFGSENQFVLVGFMLRFLLCLEDEVALRLAERQDGMAGPPPPSSLRCLFGRVEVDQYIVHIRGAFDDQLRTSPESREAWEALAAASDACGLDLIPTPPPPPAEGRLLWRYRTEGAVLDSPVVADGVVYFGAEDDHLYAVHAITGELVWRIPMDDAWMAASEGVLYVSSDSHLHAVDAKTGDIVWKSPTGPIYHRATPYWSRLAIAPAIVDGVVYVGSDDRNLYAVDGATGVLLWRYETGASIRTSPAVANGVVFVGSDDNHLYALDAATGSLRWRYQAVGLVSSPTVAGGIVYFGAGYKYLYAVNVTTGDLLWRIEQVIGPDGRPAVAQGVVYIGFDHTLSAWDAATGSNLWEHPAPGILPSSPTVADGVVYIGSQDHHLYAVDAITGESRWNYLTLGQIYSLPAVADGIVYFGSGDNYLYALPIE